MKNEERKSASLFFFFAAAQGGVLCVQASKIFAHSNGFVDIVLCRRPFCCRLSWWKHEE